MKKSAFSISEGIRQKQLLGTQLLGGSEGRGFWTIKGKPVNVEIILRPEDSLNTLYPEIRKDALDYFRRYNISWWRQNEDRYFPTGHLLSSQNHCLNHMFAIRNNQEAVLAMIRPIGEAAGIHFDKVLPSFIDTEEKKDSFITFEFVYHNVELIQERFDKRGADCTSIDALIYAQAGETKWLLPIEWKYTESYDHKPTRNSFNRYKNVITKDSRLPEWGNFYKVDPFYELGRQTLLMEKIIAEKPCNLEVDNFLHIVVIPEGNTEMRNDAKCFRNTIKKEWRDLFTIVSPEDFLSPVNEYEPNLICYLSKRYWD